MEAKRQDNFAVGMYFVFKMLPIIVAGLSIYLGYKLFLLGVTGKASLVVDANDIKGQLTNAAPGLFFGVGGITALIISVLKGVKLQLGSDGLLALSGSRNDFSI